MVFQGTSGLPTGGSHHSSTSFTSSGGTHFGSSSAPSFTPPSGPPGLPTASTVHPQTHHGFGSSGGTHFGSPSAPSFTPPSGPPGLPTASTIHPQTHHGLGSNTPIGSMPRETFFGTEDLQNFGRLPARRVSHFPHTTHHHTYVPTDTHYHSTSSFVPVGGDANLASCPARFCLGSLIFLILAIAIVSICLLAIVA